MAGGVAFRPPRGTTTERVELDGCRAEWVRPARVAPRGRVVIYLHGGAYIVGGLATHRRLAARLAAAADASVLNVAYRMLPRWPLHAAVNDGVAAYRRLLAEGVSPNGVVIAGDSAGGGLAFLVALAAREQGLPRPAGIVALSPLADLDPSGKRAHPNAASDPFAPLRAAELITGRLIAKGDALDPGLSPVNGDLTGLPPVLIHVGTTEVLESDASALAERLAAGGVPVSLKHWRGQIHDFQLLDGLLPEARAAIEEIGQFIAHATTAAAASKAA